MKLWIRGRKIKDLESLRTGYQKSLRLCELELPSQPSGQDKIWAEMATLDQVLHLKNLFFYTH